MLKAISLILCLAFLLAILAEFNLAGAKWMKSDVRKSRAKTLKKADIVGRLTKVIYEATGHYCPRKPRWLFFIPAWLWYHITCAKIAQ